MYMHPSQVFRSLVRGLAIVVAIAVLATACSDGDDTSQSPPSGDRGDATATATPATSGSSGSGASSTRTNDEGDGSDQNGSEGEGITVSVDGEPPATDTMVTIDLSETSERASDAAVTNRTVSGESVSDTERDQLLNRLEGFDAEPGDQVEFARPTDTRPPPRPLTIVDAEFPPPPTSSTPAEADDGPLEVLRFQPQGPVDTVPFISVTFSKPMVPVGTVGAVELEDVPLLIEPAIDGRWIWLGTRTVRFEHTSDDLDRLPKATEYVVTVPVGAAADDGSTLAAGVEFAFTTPAAQVTAVSPRSDSLALDTLFVVEFNQRVDAGDAIERLQLLADGSEIPIRLASADEIQADPDTQRAAADLLDDRWLVFRAVDDLPIDSPITITAKSVPSAEGPLIGDEPASFFGRTYGQFTFVEQRCSWGDNECPPGSPWTLRFSNPIDAETFDSSFISIEPALPGAQISVQYDSLIVQGQSAGRTDYTVTITESLQDVFGQTLEDDVDATFSIGDAEPALFRSDTLLTLDPIVDDGVYTVSSINHASLDLLVYEVAPLSDWAQFQENSWQLGTDQAAVDWRVVADTTLTPPATPNAWVQTSVDLSDYLAATGHVVVVITPGDTAGLEPWQREPRSQWVQRTDLGIDAYSTEFNRLTRVTSLSTGEPVAGASVSPITETGRVGNEAVTDSDGIAIAADQSRLRSLVASYNGDQAILGNFWSQLAAPRDELRWYVIDDRGLYKPGETANVKGFVRVAAAAEPASLSLPASGEPIRWIARDAFGNEFATGAAQLSDLGGFDLAIEIPADITPGPGGIEFTAGRSQDGERGFHYHELQIQQFRRPDFEVSVETTGEGPYIVGDSAQLLTEADYFATGPLAGAEVNWQVTARAGSYSPPGWSEFTFGIWQPWWFGGDGFGRGPSIFPGNQLASASLQAATDASGEHGLQLAVAIDGKPRPLSLGASATVIDVNRQAISGSTDLLMHPGAVYVGLRGDRAFVSAGEDLTTEIVATTIDGDVVTDQPVTVELIRNTWQFTNGSWGQVDDLVDTCEVTTAQDPVSCTFAPELGGSYRIAATVIDDMGRPNLTELTRWVAGESRPPNRRVELEQVTLIPQGEGYEPGDTVEVLVQSPFVDAHGLAIITRGSIASHQLIDFDDAGSAVLRLPVTQADMPAIGLHVEVVGTAPRGDSARPAFASAQLTLEVSTASRRLTVTATPAASKLAPGQDTSVDVVVTTASGAPVAGAELAVIVVDEAVLSLTNYELRDVLAAFYQRTGGWLQAQRGRSSLVLSAQPELALTDGDDAAFDTAEAMEDESSDAPAAPQAAMLADDGGASLARSSAVPTAGAAAAKASDGTAIDLRTDFDALAIFEPEVTTDDDGRATIDVPLPDSLTRYRVMVVAVGGADLAGTAESNLTARLPISVRPTAPRFANFGDRFEFPVVVQNATDEDRDVSVAIRATNLDLAERNAVTVNVPANDRVEVRFDAAADLAGVARYQVVAASGDLADAAQGEFPVYTPATSEAFATYGVIDDGAVGQNIVAPTDVFPQFGGLEISTSSTAVSSLTDAVISLRDHPYQNADALASRIIAIISLDSILAAFESPDLSAAQLDQAVTNDVERLLALQNADGGFGWWRRNETSVPWVTVSATHALVLANKDGRDINAVSLDNALGLLARIESIFPAWYDEKTKTAIRAYAIHVEHLAGVDVNASAEALYQRTAPDLSPDVAAWLWPALGENAEISGEIERLLNNRVTETANAATFATSYGEQDWVLVHSDRRTDAIVLDALLDQKPDSDLVVKTLNGLLAARGQRGAWRNVQENSWILIAAGRYFDEFEVADPAFVARAWLGDTYALAHEHQERRTEQDRTTVPMSEVIDAGDQQLVIDKDGDGRLYYRVGLRYAPTDLVLEPRDRGFVVQRSYEGLDDDSDVVRNDDGTWTITAGARVRIRVTMVADSRRTHVALIDPLPAGLEAINPVFATSEPVPPEVNPGDEPTPFASWFRWFNHQNLRDDRAEAFTTWLGAGSYEYTYVARATIPGTFVVPPARAEQLYEPEVFGRSASTTVTVVDQ